MKIINVLKNHYVGSRLYCQGVQYEAEDEVVDAMIAEGVADLETIPKRRSQAETEDTKEDC